MNRYKFILIALGTLSLFNGIIGVVVPVLPTIPSILPIAGLNMKSSDINH